jgi:hypothetical protein
MPRPAAEFALTMFTASRSGEFDGTDPTLEATIGTREDAPQGRGGRRTLPMNGESAIQPDDQLTQRAVVGVAADAAPQIGDHGGVERLGAAGPADTTVGDAGEVQPQDVALRLPQR